MTTLKCTQKVQKLLGLKSSQVSNSPDSDPFFSWYVNTFDFDRRKVLVFVHQQSYVSFLYAGFKKEHQSHISQIFYDGLFTLMRYEGVSQKLTESLMDGYPDVIFAKTDDRSIVGSMNDITFHYTYNLDAEGLAGSDLFEISKSLNRMPHVKRDEPFPIIALTGDKNMKI